LKPKDSRSLLMAFVMIGLGWVAFDRIVENWTWPILAATACLFFYRAYRPKEERPH
jgi:hypothetical protein